MATSLNLPASVTGSGASATARLRDRRVLRRRRGLIPIQRVRPEEGTEEAESARIQFKQDKARAARLEASQAAGGALEETFLRQPNAARCRALWTQLFFSLCFLVDVFHFLKIENHLENNNNNKVQKEIFFCCCQMKIKKDWKKLTMQGHLWLSSPPLSQFKKKKIIYICWISKQSLF